MANLWHQLGFKHDPYSTDPLLPRKEDVELLVGRENEAIELCTALESANKGIFAISGVPGVGKTSFFNIQQYLLESKSVPFGPHLLAARHLCPIQPNDSPRDVAQRAALSLVKSIEEYCSLNTVKVPKQVEKISKWLNASGNGGFDIGIEILGCGGSFGRNTELPAVNDVSFEGFKDTIQCLTSVIVNELKFEGAFLVFDNTENLSDEELGQLLISFRDTLFSVPCAWWILIGQSGLGSLIQALDPRVSERMTGGSLELHPIPIEKFNEAIDIRVETFHESNGAKSPLPRSVHRHLYKASHGEIRFVFKYSSSICIRFITDIRKSILSKQKTMKNFEDVLNKALGKALVNEVLPEPAANRTLEKIITEDISGLSLTNRQKRVLGTIHENKGARPKDFRQYGCNSISQFSSQLIKPLHTQKLLLREQEGRAVTYRLRGIALLASEFGLFDEAMTFSR